MSTNFPDIIQKSKQKRMTSFLYVSQETLSCNRAAGN